MSIDELSRPPGPPARQRRRQGVYWIATIPFEGTQVFTPEWPYGLPEPIVYAKGQLERGESTDYLHWQVLFVCGRKVSARFFHESICRTGHYELSRSSAADSYVHKEETRVEGTQFELGSKPIRRNSHEDWDSVWRAAAEGRLLDIPSQIRVIKYLTLDLSL